MMSTSFVPRTLEVAEMVCMLDPQAIVLPDGALTKEAEVDRATFSALNIVGLNLAMLPSEAIHSLQDGVIVELQAREQHALNIINE